MAHFERGVSREAGYAKRLSGFGVDFVGLFVEFSRLPDKDRTLGLNKLGAKCRVCRVYLGGESPGEVGNQNRYRASPALSQFWPSVAWRPFLDSSWTPVATFRRAGKR